MIVFIRRQKHVDRQELLGIHLVDEESSVNAVLEEYDDNIEYFVLKGNVKFTTGGNIRRSRVYISKFELPVDIENALLNGEWLCQKMTA
ncbi:hypothetical protein BCT46_02325 [Vibrio sp. 10N.261.46.E8]|nr:hypothetical protein BH584_00585 [Vibrio sp. 10N.261.45.E1]PMJ19333.1 hypothetical protein BCU27_21650 [Vibrio sp. 10N.286.45.B6]PML97976.1 hypothetical protein BCT66_20630 [Vibrio sp. 10N.261.49.E11]PMM83130.1 hypothetical protein BCT46_02325 [Vibrio sp. 10N.261.46.E8]PMN59088.1 hypothetical protein BCT32_22355 [Vibrio sp. 10N.261.45.E11]PMN84320.1 hypothetical protein BCT22_11490 [Vibrio sp. 10N.261.45.A1]